MNLLMISGDIRAAQGAKGEFYEMLRKFHPFWDRIDVVCPRTAEAEDRTLFDGVNIFPVSRWSYPGIRAKLSQPFYTSLKAKELIKDRLRQGDPYGLMTVHEVPPFHVSWAALRLARRYGLPVVSELHHVEGYPLAADLPSLLRRTATGLWVRYLGKRVDAIRTVNAVEVPEYLRSRGVPDDRIKVIYSFDIDLNQFSPADVDRDLDFLFVGRLVPNKGIEIFIRALGLIKNDHPELKAVVIGQGPQAGAIHDLALALDLEPNLEFISWVKDREALTGYYRRAKALCVCSFSEGGPNVTLEAMACKTPCLGPSIGIHKEILIDGKNGLITGHHPRTVAAAMARILDEPGLAERLGAKGPATAAGFEAGAVIEAYARGLQEVALGLGGPGAMPG